MNKQELSNIILASSRLGFNDCDRIADAIDRYIDDKLNEQKEKENLPSAEKTAKGNTTELYWLQYDANPRIGNWHCTKCNMIVSVQNPNYCPNCGRKMKGAEK